MSVLGVGMDLVELRGFAEQLEAPGSSFTGETFTAAELSSARGSSGPAAHLGARFAAKEAFIKAFSVAILGRAPVVDELDWREIEVANDPWGRPTLALHGSVAEAVASTLGPIRIQLSLTHEPNNAGAMVLIEGEQ